MKQLYYGIWQEMYYHVWPVRLLIELLVILLFVSFLWNICKDLGKILHLKRNIVRFVFFLVTEFDGIFGRNSAWSIANDKKISNWARGILEQPSEKRSLVEVMLKRVLAISLISAYILAATPDLPYRSMINPYYLQYFSRVKDKFQSIEATLSEGYENYPSIFQKKTQQASQENSLSLIRAEKKKILIYKKPSVKAKVIGKIKNNQEILYKNQYKKIGEKYWLKVYLPEKEVTGWIDGRFIESNQVNEIVKQEKGE